MWNRQQHDFWCAMLTAYTPYLIGADSSHVAPSHAAKSMVNRRTNSANNRKLTNIALSIGGDNTLVIADISAKLQAFGIVFWCTIGSTECLWTYF